MIPALTLAITNAASAVPKLDGIALGSPVSGVLSVRGNADVQTTDIGHIWTWRKAGAGTLRITTDDDGIIRLIDIAPAAPRAPHAADFLAAGTLPGTNVPVLFSGYKLGGSALLIVAREGGTVSREAFLGYRDEFVRAGFIPNAHSATQFQAPVLEKLGGADYSSTAQGTAYVRIAVASTGAATAATVYASSGDASLDRIAIVSALHDTFSPAQLDGKPVPSVYFRREDFVHAKPR